MRTSIILLLFTLMSFSPVDEKDIEVIDVNGYDRLILSTDDRLYVINFWATWCKPCVAELPMFMQVNDQYPSSQIQMILVSLDEPEALNHDIPSLQEKLKIDVPIYLLDDPMNMSSWINSVSTEWSGAIPATAFYKNNKLVAFHEGKMTESDLNHNIQQHQ